MSGGCRHDLLNALADGRLSPADADRLEEHLRSCPACRVTLERLTDDGNLSGSARIPVLEGDPGIELPFLRRLEAVVPDLFRSPGESLSSLSGPVAPRSAPPADRMDALLAKPDPRVGGVLGKYRISSMLGRGGMGVVYEAVDAVAGRTYAVKLLPAALSREMSTLAQFLREARVASRLRHPNVVAVHEVGRQGDEHYIVMELVRGGSAEAALQRRGKLPWPEATAVVADVCRGLAAAHAQGLIHRDIKPANILLASDGTAKLSDFGTAWGATTGAGRASASAGMLSATPAYMSPEQCQGRPPDPRSDLYSLGAAYYALLVGRPPFADAGSESQVMFAHLNRPAPDPRRSEPSVPAGCAGIIARALAKEPADRYADAGAMLAALETVRAAKPAAS